MPPITKSPLSTPARSYTIGSATSISHDVDHVPPAPEQLAGTITQGGTAASTHGGGADTQAGWEPFFYTDMSPTPTFTRLIDAIFTHLDPKNTGCLAPETFSRLLDDMGYTPQENAWKANLTAGFGQTKEAAADAALKRALDAFGIEHVCKPRPGARSSLFGGGGGGVMPLLTRRGLADITAVELLADPSGEYPKFVRAVARYALQPFARWGPVPRWVLPPNPDPRMLARVAAAQSGARQDGQDALAAAQMAAQIQADANQAAVYALGTTEYVYRY
ncbi:hypothetical protein FB451DRAFT_1553793 [Mycena latifolia]|nr:hypothetical protein FB451DRAFT_1553793 [Mycena latifolia]